MLTQTEALKRCQEQFHSYARQHRAKGTPEGEEKAEVNDDMAWMCEDALSHANPKPEGEPAWRPEVRAFADLMEAQLKANDHKPGWKRDYSGDLFKRIADESEDLHAVLSNYEFRDGSDSDADHIAAIGREAANVANLSLMIADVCGALSTPTDQQSHIAGAKEGWIKPGMGDIRAVCDALGFDPTNHHNAAKCPYCAPIDQQPKAEGWRPISEAPKVLDERTRIPKEKTGLSHDLCLGKPIAIAVRSIDFPNDVAELVRGCWSLGPHGGFWWDIDGEEPLDRDIIGWIELPSPQSSKAEG